MKIQFKKMILGVLLLFSLVVITMWGLATIEYQNSKAIAVAKNFVHYLQIEEYDSAYSLTMKNSDVGKDIGEFNVRLKKELGEAQFKHSQIIYLTPFQSWGNYIRRKVYAAECKKGQKINIGFSLYGRAAPFQVRVVSDAQCYWAVSYFQTHAM